jgi:hypothetical protein
VNVNVEQIVLLLHDHLIASADNQSVETKPWGNPGERSQASSVMDSREEACLHGLAGWRLGWTEDEHPSLERSPFFPPQLGSSCCRSNCGYRQPVRIPVLHAVMPGIKRVHTTGEVPRGLLPPGRVTASYKQAVKGSPDALVAGTRSHRPCPWGCQQRQSSPATRDERQNRSWPIKSSIVFGIVSPAAAATKWPAGTSSRQPVGLLRNVPRHGDRSIWTKHEG